VAARDLRHRRDGSKWATAITSTNGSHRANGHTRLVPAAVTRWAAGVWAGVARDSRLVAIVESPTACPPGGGVGAGTAAVDGDTAAVSLLSGFFTGRGWGRDARCPKAGRNSASRLDSTLLIVAECTGCLEPIGGTLAGVGADDSLGRRLAVRRTSHRRPDVLTDSATLIGPPGRPGMSDGTIVDCSRGSICHAGAPQLRLGF